MLGSWRNPITIPSAVETMEPVLKERSRACDHDARVVERLQGDDAGAILRCLISRALLLINMLELSCVERLRQVRNHAVQRRACVA